MSEAVKSAVSRAFWGRILHGLGRLSRLEFVVQSVNQRTAIVMVLGLNWPRLECSQVSSRIPTAWVSGTNLESVQSLSNYMEFIIY